MACELHVPGDLSSAAFFLVAALIVPESGLTIHGVGLNPTRSALLDFLAEMGAQIKILDVSSTGRRTNRRRADPQIARSEEAFSKKREPPR